MKASHFSDACVAATKVIGRKEVNVVFRGSEAYTDGDTVILPAISSASEVDEHSADVIRGYRDHESLHVRCTDMKHSPALQARRAEDTFYGDLTNVIEDVRIERAGISAYPGMIETLSATQRAAGEILKGEVDGKEASVHEAPPKNQLLIALQAMGRQRLGMDMGYYDEFIKHIKPEVLDFAKSVTDRVMALKTGAESGVLNRDEARAGSDDSMALSAEVYQEYQRLFQHEKNPMDQPNVRQGPGDGKAGKQGQRNKGKGDGDEGEEQPGGNGSGNGDVTLSSPDELAKQALEETIDGIEQTGSPDGAPQWRVFDRRLRAKGPAVPLMKAARSNFQAQPYVDIYEKMRGQITNQAAMLRRILEVEMQARMDRIWQSGKTSGRLHQIRVVDALHGAPNVYQARQTGKEMDTLLVMSIDGSGSMGGRIGDCMRLAIALSDALERTGAEIAVEMWDSTQWPGPQKKAWGDEHGGGDPNGAQKAYTEDVERRMDRYATERFNVSVKHLQANGEDTKLQEVYEKYERRYATLGSVRRVVIKSPKQRMSSPEVKAGFGLMPDYVSGSTPMIDAVDWTLDDMARMQHSKKVLLVMTDGQPDGPTEFNDHSVSLAHMKRLQAFAKRSNIHMIGVGMGVRVDRWFKHAVSVRGEVYEKVMKEVATYIREDTVSTRRAA